MPTEDQDKEDHDENVQNENIQNENIQNKEQLPVSIEHEDLKLLLNWKGRTIHDWTYDDIQLGHLIRKRHYKPHEVLTEDEKKLIGRVVLDQSRTDEKIPRLSALRMWIPKV